MAVQPFYNQGTVSVTSGSNQVVGAGTAFALALVNGGTLSTKGLSIPIQSVEDDTHLTLAYAAPAGMAGSGLAYAIELGRADVADAIRANRLLADLVQVLSGSVSPYMRGLLDDADASTALSTLGVSSFSKGLLDDADATTALSTLGVSSFIKGLLDDADAATARATLGAGPIPVVFQAFGANESNGLDSVIVARQTVDFSAVGPRALVTGSSVFSAMTSDSAYAYLSMRLYDITSGSPGTVVTDTNEQVIGIIPDALGGVQSGSRSMIANGLTAGRIYRAGLWIRSNFVNRVRPGSMLISGVNL